VSVDVEPTVCENADDVCSNPGEALKTVSQSYVYWNTFFCVPQIVFLLAPVLPDNTNFFKNTFLPMLGFKTFTFFQ
jgi:hypothetical protein